MDYDYKDGKKRILEILNDTNDEIQIYLVSNKALIIIGHIAFITRLIEGNYPDTSSLFPRDQLTVLELKKSEILSSIDRVSLFTNLDSSNIIKFLINANKSVQLASTNNEIGKVVEEILPLNIPSINNFQTAFSAKYLNEAIKAFDGNIISISFTGEIKPFVISCEADPGLLQLILPVRIF